VTDVLRVCHSRSAFWALAVLGIVNVVSAVALLRWRRWVFWAFIASAVAAVAINLSIGLGAQGGFGAVFGGSGSSWRISDWKRKESVASAALNHLTIAVADLVSR
jgi:predicted membrane metal-binding protein